MREKFHVTCVRPDAYPAGEALQITATILGCALRRLGADVRVGINEFLHDATNIIVGAHLLDADVAATLPDGTIIFNTEPLEAGRPHAEALRPFVERFRVWDYDPRNLAPLRALGNRDADVVKAGYLPEMTSVVHSRIKDIDVLFYGELSERRRDVLGAIERRGHRVVWLHDVYGAARDPWIGRAKLVASLHYCAGAPFAIGRVVHLLANRCAVVAEAEAAGDVDADLAPGLATAPASRIPDLVDALIADGARREQLAAQGFACITGGDYCANIHHALERRAGRLPEAAD